ncbi:MAG: DoxX family membrane protein [Jejuia sp.]
MIKSQEYISEWTKREIVTFKLIFTYFCFYIFLMFFSSFFETPFKWFGSILGFTKEYSVSGNGSGDNTYAYVTFYATIVLALVVSTIWILVDRNKKSYNKLFYWFIVVLRIFLICAMLLYGFVKIFKVQFPDPSLSKLMQPLGNFSPMGLAWTYMGHSKMFNVFVGAMEVLGGLLLILRRTQTIGSFIVSGVMTHVLVMNLCFDIPVKLFSAHLVLMSLVIFSTDIKRFINVFIKNKPVKAYEYYHPINNKKYHKIIRILKIVGLSIIIIGVSIFMFQAERKLNNYKKTVFYGIWETEYFVQNNDTLPPLITDKGGDI